MRRMRNNGKIVHDGIRRIKEKNWIPRIARGCDQERHFTQESIKIYIENVEFKMINIADDDSNGNVLMKGKHYRCEGFHLAFRFVNSVMGKYLKEMYSDGQENDSKIKPFESPY